MISKAPGQKAGSFNVVKRPLFKKPSWANTQIGGDDFSGDLFRRSAHAYVDPAAEATLKKRKKAARQENVRDHTSANGERFSKRRHLSATDEEEDTDTGDSENKFVSHTNIGPGSSNAQELLTRQSTLPNIIKSQSLAYIYKESVGPAQLEARNQSKAHPTHIIDLEDESDDDVHAIGAKIEAVTVPQDESASQNEEEVLHDDEFPELARKAREKARRKRLEDDMVHHTQSPATALENNSFSLPRNIPQRTPPPPAPDPTLHILITSAIEGTQSLIVSRKLSQRLKDVRLAWVDRQGLGPDFVETVFLTWRGKRLFDVTSCKSLGINVDSNGQVVHKDDVLGDEDGRLHMEATTSALFAANMKAKHDAKIGEDSKALSYELSASITREPDPDPQVRIILKAKCFDDFKLIVKHTTTVSKIVNSFRSTNSIPQEKEVFLCFDGEKMSPEGTIADTDISDMDYIDAYVK